MLLRCPKLAVGPVALLALLLVPAASWAGDAGDWLLKMSGAAKQNNYQGVVTYRGDEMLETFRVTHRWQEGIERERVQSLSGEPRDIIKQDGKTICLLPQSRRMSSAQQPTPQGLFPGLTPEKVSLLSKIYEFDDLGMQRVAGRMCRGIAITPRDRYRYGYEVWADLDSAVPLKVNLIGRDGTVLEQMQFTEVQFPKLIPDSAFVVPGGQNVREPAPPAPPAAPMPPQPVTAEGLPHLPPGFRVTMRDVRVLANGRGTVEHVLLSDGISAISIFARRSVTAPDKGFRGISQMGAVNAYGRTVGSVQITVVGEAPQETIKMVGDGYRPAPEPPVAVASPASPAPPAPDK